MAVDLGFNPFQSSKKEKSAPENKGHDFSSDFIHFGRRMKVVEEGMNNLRKKVLVNEQNDMNRHKKIILSEKTTLTELNELKKEIENIKRILKEVISELRGSAKKEDVTVLKKYIDMWNPVKFATEETVEKIIDEKISNLKS